MAEAAHADPEKILNPGSDVFRVPPTDLSINAYRMVTIHPTITGINPMEFTIPAVDNHVDLNRCYFTMDLRLKKDDAGNLGADEKLWVTNKLAHTIIKQIDLRLNGTLINPQSDTYHYKAYLETLMNYKRDDGKTLLRPQGWFNTLDFPPEWTANNTNTTNNAGAGHNDYQALFANHKSALAQSKVEMAYYLGGARHSLVFQPHLEAFHMGEILVPGVEIKLKFHFNSPNLFLNGLALAGRLLEDDIKLQVHLCQLRLNEDVYKNLSVRRHKYREMAKYLTVRSEIRTFNMVWTMTRFDIPNLFQNPIPDRMIVGLLDSRAFTRDPFCFQKFGLRTIREMVKGEGYPYETLQINRNNGARDALGYFWFLQASGAWYKKRGNMVQQEFRAKIARCSCLTMWPTDAPTLAPSTPDKRESCS